MATLASLPEFADFLRAEQLLLTVSREVDPRFELHAVVRKIRPAQTCPCFSSGYAAPASPSSATRSAITGLSRVSWARTRPASRHGGPSSPPPQPSRPRSNTRRHPTTSRRSRSPTCRTSCTAKRTRAPISPPAWSWRRIPIPKSSTCRITGCRWSAPRSCAAGSAPQGTCSASTKSLQRFRDSSPAVGVRFPRGPHAARLAS